MLTQTFRLLIYSALFVFATCEASGKDTKTTRVLFVGNSLTYVGNLPAVFSSLSISNGNGVASDMIVRGGATLTQRVNDGSVASALSDGDYTVLVLQERGGDLMCSFGPNSCIESQQAIGNLASLGKEHGTRVILLGSYQKNAGASEQLVNKESAAANVASISYIKVSSSLQTGLTVSPALEWFYEDGIHPGSDLILLEAALLHEEIFGEVSAPSELLVDAPIYTNNSGLTPILRSATALPPRAETPKSKTYTSANITGVFDVLTKAGS